MSRQPSERETRARAVFTSQTNLSAEALYFHAKELRDLDNNLDYARRLLTIAAGKLAGANPLIRYLVAHDLALCTYKSSDLPPDERFKTAEALCLQLLSEGALAASQVQDVLGMLGSIWKQRWRVYGLREHLEKSLFYYKQGMEKGLELDNGYTALNAAFALDLLSRSGNVPDAESLKASAREIRTELCQTLAAMAEKNSALTEDFWFLATLGEAHLGLADFPNALRYMTLAGQRLPPPWQLETTARQAAEVARSVAKDAGIDLDHLVDSEAWRAVQALVGGNSDAAFSFLLGKVGLALSGGGFRASLFHIGVLARLAELDMLRHVEVISCVSGGSIIGAFYYLELRRKLQEKADRGVTQGGVLCQDDYLEIVRNLEVKFLAGIQKNIRLRMLLEFNSNWRVLSSKRSSMTERLATLYDRELYSTIEDEFQGTDRQLSDILIQPLGEAPNFSPRYSNWTRRNKVPILILNSTTLNTCHNWQFTATFMGEPPPRGIQADIDANDRLRRMYFSDAPPGYREPGISISGERIEKSTIKLSEAVAASACVPSLFDPLVFDDLYGTTSASNTRIPYVPRLVDGGAYDNQGVSSLLEQDCTVLLVSDACGQTGVSLDPGGSRLAVMQRSNNILMARVREAQYQQLATLRDSNVLRGLMYVHLKKSLESTAVDWIDCPEPTQRLTPSTCTPYCMRRDVQTLLSRVRTDLDSFSDCEADALMLSGYLMTNTDFAECIRGFPVHDIGPKPWRFRQIEHIATNAVPTSDTQLLRKALEISEQIAFKPWRIALPLKIVGGLFAFLLFAAILCLCWVAWEDPVPGIPIAMGKILTTLLALSATLLFVHWILQRFVRYRNPYAQVLFSFAMCFLGWWILPLHLRLIEPFYLRFGPKYRKSASS